MTLARRIAVVAFVAAVAAPAFADASGNDTAIGGTVARCRYRTTLFLLGAETTVSGDTAKNELVVPTAANDGHVPRRARLSDPFANRVRRPYG